MKPKLLTQNETQGIWETFWPDLESDRVGLTENQVINANLIFCRVNDECTIILKNRFGLSGPVDKMRFEWYMQAGRELFSAKIKLCNRGSENEHRKHQR